MLFTFIASPAEPEPVACSGFLFVLHRILVDSEVADEFRLLTAKARSRQGYLRERCDGGGRRADGAIPPARYRRAAGIPGENARLTALAMLIFELRQH